MENPATNLTALDFEILIARALSCEDFSAAQALAELAARGGIKLNGRWIKKRWISQLGLWQVRREPATQLSG